MSAVHNVGFLPPNRRHLCVRIREDSGFRAQEEYGIFLSTGKIRKILITGGCWSTERSREVAELYEKYGSIEKVARELEVSEALVKMYLPYQKVVYDLEEKSGNAKRIARWRRKQRKADDGSNAGKGLT